MPNEEHHHEVCFGIFCLTSYALEILHYVLHVLLWYYDMIGFLTSHSRSWVPGTVENLPWSLSAVWIEFLAHTACANSVDLTSH